jgi:hypothetical protein
MKFASLTKVIVSIRVFDLFLHSMITLEFKFHLIYSCIYLELIPRANQCICMTWLNMSGHYSLNGNRWNLLTEIVIYKD